MKCIAPLPDYSFSNLPQRFSLRAVTIPKNLFSISGGNPQFLQKALRRRCAGRATPP
jgi:hypothetical protein